jgi:hypothetical protein
MAQQKQMSASQPLVFILRSLILNSQTCAFSAPSSACADGLLINGATKTNVCFAAACFYFALIISLF